MAKHAGSGGTGPGQHRKHPYSNLPKRERKLLRGIDRQGITKGTSQPPALSYDPALEAQRRAAQRGAQDLVRDTFIKQHQARQDFGTTRHDYRVKRHRGRQDYGTSLERGLLGLHQKATDQRLSLARGREDFTTALTNLGRRFNILGNTQLQSANAQGVADAGTLAAGAAARAANFGLAKQQLVTRKQRLAQDTQTNLHRIGTQRGQLRQDTRLGLNRLQTDTHHDIHLAHRDLHRTVNANRRTLGRGLREQQIGDAALQQEEIFSARQNYPGAFAVGGQRTKKKHVPYVPGG